MTLSTYQRNQLAIIIKAAQSILDDEVRQESTVQGIKQGEVNTVLNLVSIHYHISHNQLLSKRRTKHLAWARYMAVALLRNELKLTLPHIDSIFHRTYKKHQSTWAQSALKALKRRFFQDMAFGQEYSHLLTVVREKLK